MTNRSRSNFQLALSISSPAATTTNELFCLEWGEFSGADLSKVTKTLAGMNLGNNVATREVDQLTRYWVYIPPLPSKAAINRKITQLKARGISKYFIVQKPGDLHNAISLGAFKSPDAAQNFLEELQATRDIHTAKVRERVEKLQATTFLLKDVDAAIVTRVTAMQKEFPDVDLKNIACTH
ncbi:MAG: SPOR domain-containing protein [Gallionella sp.]